MEGEAAHLFAIEYYKYFAKNGQKFTLDLEEPSSVKCSDLPHFGSRGSWVRIPSPRQSFKTVGYQDNMNLKANGFFSCLDVSFSLLFVNLKKSFEHFCITLCNYVTLFSHIIHKMGCKCGFLRILYTIINAEI